MSLGQVLAANNITANEAWDFIVVNIDKPEHIFSEVSRAGLSFEMLSELVAQFDSGISANAINHYFAEAGLDVSTLTADITPTPEAPVTNGAVVGSSSEGLIVIDPVGPLTNDQALFITGLLASSELAFVPGDEDGVVLNEMSRDGLFVNVRFHDTNYTDLTFTLTPNDVQALESAEQTVNQVYLNAVQQAGYESFDALDARGTQGEINAIQSSIENTIVNFTKPQYDALFAGTSDLWTFV